MQVSKDVINRPIVELGRPVIVNCRDFPKKLKERVTRLEKVGGQLFHGLFLVSALRTIPLHPYPYPRTS
jgi:hypothetical protein